MNSTILSKVQGCFAGVFLGDGLGMPAETLSRAQIKAVTHGEGILGFSAPLTNREWMETLKPGDLTDDSQLTTVVALSLIRKKKFDLDDMAALHVEALAASTFGWGDTSRLAIEEIRDGQRLPSERARDYGPKRGSGNGVIMKIAPLALYHAMTRKPFTGTDHLLLDDVLLLGGLTHFNEQASITAYAVARLMFEIFHHSCRTSDQVRAIVQQILTEIRLIEKQGNTEASDRLKKLLDSATTASSESLEIAVGNRFHCLDTMAFTIGTFMRHPTDFRKGVLEAVNAGGDTDTNASIVGALIGINCGLTAIPEEWLKFSPNVQEALKLGQQFCVEGV